MVKITLDLKKSIEENAGMYFDSIKKLRKKREGALLALKEAEDKKKSLLRKQELDVMNHKASVKKERKKEWYEKFRWFVSSEGFLCIGGRDATTNEIIIKKHTEKDDIVFHTDMAGSPFFVIKCESKKPGEDTIHEAADATVTFSRAWKIGLMNSSVFYVKPEQVTKKAQSGEYLQKGSFMIRGKTNYVENKIDLAVGLYEEKIMAGPLKAIKAHCKEYVAIEQGDEKASVIAKKIRKVIDAELDDIIRALPSGSFKIVK